jgi:two-component system chemotaxis response regulator CheY
LTLLAPWKSDGEGEGACFDGLGRTVAAACQEGTQMRALVVDDSRTVRIIIANILRELGMEVIEAGNGLEALEQIERGPEMDLMLVDWNMPQMNGFDFIRTVRSRREFDAVRILMVTSESQVEQVTQALGAGANEYLMKPFNKEVLVAKLNLLDAIQE